MIVHADMLDRRCTRTNFDLFNEGTDVFRFAGGNNLNTAVRPVPHPTTDIKRLRHPESKRAEADALHASGDLYSE
jgi:hypothetical protein